MIIGICMSNVCKCIRHTTMDIKYVPAGNCTIGIMVWLPEIGLLVYLFAVDLG